MILLIDNYDSFTYNLYHYMLEIGAEVEVIRNDKITIEEIKNKNYEGIIISPGPCSPNEAGICLDVVKSFKGEIPIFGVCLGHQTIGQIFGGEVVRAKNVMHAKISEITHYNNSKIFSNIPEKFKATRYHSLIVEHPDLKITAKSEDGVIQAFEHEEYPIFGVQFHPESIASEYGHEILRNFYNICKEAK